MTSLPCPHCHAAIIYLRTHGGVVPVNANSVQPGDSSFDKERHVSHNTTCEHKERTNGHT